MGDFNARIGTAQKDERAVGPFGIGQRDGRGESLVNFTESNNLYIINSFFQKKSTRKWTWISPKGNTSEIDFIISDQKIIFTDCCALNRFNVGSDHRLVRAKIKINCHKERIKLVNTTKKVDVTQLSYNRPKFEFMLANSFQTLAEIENADITVHNDTIVKSIIDVSSIVAPCKDIRVESKISKETISMLKQRRVMKRGGNIKNKIEYVELCKTIRKRIKEDIRNYNVRFIERTLNEGQGLKKTKRKLTAFKKQMFALRLKDGEIIKDQKQIIMRIVEFYSDLYRETRPNVQVKFAIKSFPSIMLEEVENAIGSMNNGRAAGQDRVCIEMLKCGGRVLHQALAKLFERCLLLNEVPTSWKEAEVILLHKKGDQSDLKNYRPISLLPSIYKVFTKILARRIAGQLDAAQPKEQGGFRKGFSTLDHIQTIQQIIERHNEHAIPLGLVFIDYEKAFDSVTKQAIINALINQGVDEPYIAILQTIYDGATASIRVNDKRAKINIEKGVRQGDTISPQLFSACLEDIFRKLDWDSKGIRINGEYLNHLRFADDLVLLSNNPLELQKNLNELHSESIRSGLNLNISKTKVMFNKYAARSNITVDGKQLENVDSYVYLGQQIGMEDMNIKEIERRVKLGWQAFGRLQFVFRTKLPLCLKRKVFDQCVLPVLTYGCETWTTNIKAIQKLQVAQRGMERRMLNISLRDRKKCSWIREQTKVCDVIRKIKSLKWKWAGHVARREDDRWTKRVIEWIPLDVKRPRQRPKVRWVDEIIKFAGPNWQHKAQDRLGWLHMGEAFILQWIDNG